MARGGFVRRILPAASLGVLSLILACSTAGRGPPPAAILAAPATPSPDEVARGAYLTAAGDCASCHTRPGGQPFAGGAPIKTNFGTIYSANITPDAATGIGAWSAADFYRALHGGEDNRGRNLYPAMPYDHFTHVRAEDVAAIRAFLMSQPAARYTPPADQLKFPYNNRSLIGVWNHLYFHPGAYEPDPSRDETWNRGAYLVTGLGHCGGCHTPRSSLGGEKADQALRGGKVGAVEAPDLNSDNLESLGSWSEGDIAAFLGTGRNDHATAKGPMKEVVEKSTSKLSQADLLAIATYLKSLPAKPGAGASRTGA